MNTLREIGDYRFKQLKPGRETNTPEEPVKRDDHAMDCVRYLANYISNPIKPVIENKGERELIVEMYENEFTESSF